MQTNLKKETEVPLKNLEEQPFIEQLGISNNFC